MTEFEKNMDILSLPQSTRDYIRNLYDAKPDWFLRAAEAAYEGKVPDFPICRRSPAERFVIWCCRIPKIYQKYKTSGIPDVVTRATLQDVTRRAVEYERRTGKKGLSKEDVIWLRHIENCEIFQIGALQFQLFHMVYLDMEGCGEAYMAFSHTWKEKLPQGTPVVNLHIPAGTDFSPAAVQSALTDAKTFFNAYFPRFSAKAFICYSWLLYPGLLELLPSDSNIRAFAGRFEIIGQVCDPYGSDSIKRIYGKRYPNKKDYPQKTLLQKNAIGHFSKLGMACGIIEIT